ncbi:hypothetical protein O9X98_15045 [Agrobacterium salinitolerans]|nr:hypothetical protein [Agrobacterium salinitolerans]
MTDQKDSVVPADFAELRNLCWNRDPNRPIARAEAFLLYDRNWRFVEEDALSDHERLLVASLEKEFGAGVTMSRWRLARS